MKKYHLWILFIYIIVQLCVPSYIVYQYYSTLKTGEKYLLEVNTYDIDDIVQSKYIILEKDDSGYATVIGESDVKPKEGIYVKNLKLNEYYMNKKIVETNEIENKMNNNMYLEMYIKKGKYIIEKVHIAKKD
ncbi:MAG: hypothetical protein ACRCSG_06835 [Cellulosilyticaceae bacterium]